MILVFYVLLALVRGKKKLTRARSREGPIQQDAQRKAEARE